MTKFGKFKDVFSGKNFGRKGDLTQLFRVEYGREYRSMKQNLIHVNDQVVREFLGL